MIRINLADECELITKGTTPTTLGLQFEDFGIPFIRAQNLIDGTVSIETDALYVSSETHAALRRSQIKPDDLLISIAGTIGRAAIVPADAAPMNCNQAVAIVRPSNRINRRFLLHWLGTADAERQMTKGKVTGTISNLSLEQIGKLEIPLPPLDEQRRIAAVLDKADALRRKRIQSLKLVDDLAQSIFFEMFETALANSLRVPLSAFVHEFRYGTSNKSDSYGYTTLRIPNVIGGGLDLSDLKLVPTEKSELDRLRLQDGDILFVRTNGNPDYVGRCAVFDSAELEKVGYDPSDWIFASYLIRARLDRSKISPIYLREYLSTSEGRRALRERSKTSAGQFNINTEGLASITIPLPPIKEQLNFARRMASVDSIKKTHHDALLRMKSAFASIQSSVFCGELT
ncbi:MULTISPECIES: restriction endonuclease subunit S [unclassified Bradyrhizobium]|uniref:restriction endonuclease subunit S n=1 Tax=unclassified Bradyrhizobium TaxID=2631580 RepID=UPI0028E7E1E8|nr:MULTISPECIES: restriction endonuclease subunit S [unclassified Bradyrhizobium]